MNMTRRNALKGGTATVAAIAASGAVAAHVAAEDSPVAAAARAFWEADARYMAALDNPDLTEDEANAYFEPWIDAHDLLMEIPSSSAKDLAAKVRVGRKVWDGCEIKMNSPDRLGALLADIERLAWEG